MVSTEREVPRFASLRCADSLMAADASPRLRPRFPKGSMLTHSPHLAAIATDTTSPPVALSTLSPGSTS